MRITKADLTPKPKVPKRKLTKTGRTTLTTLMRPELKEKLAVIADNLNTSIADVLELIVTDYLNDIETSETTR